MEDDQDGFKYTLMCFLCVCVCVCLCLNVDHTLTLCSPQPKPSPSVCLVACPYFCFPVLLTFFLFAPKRIVNCACFSLYVGLRLYLFAVNHRYYCVYTRAVFIFTLIFSFFSLRPPPTLSLPLLSSLFVCFSNLKLFIYHSVSALAVYPPIPPPVFRHLDPAPCFL